MVNVRIRSRSRKSVESEPNLVNVLNLLEIDIMNYKFQLDIVDCSLGIVSMVFCLEMSYFIGFPGLSYLMLSTFRCA